MASIKSGHPCPIRDLSRKTFSLSPVSEMFARGFVYTPFIRLKKKDDFWNPADCQAFTSIYTEALCLRAGLGDETTRGKRHCLLQEKRQLWNGTSLNWPGCSWRSETVEKVHRQPSGKQKANATRHHLTPPRMATIKTIATTSPGKKGWHCWRERKSGQLCGNQSGGSSKHGAWTYHMIQQFHS